jgi:ElaB/YqjD/DUF883 family membrane-anchored ribosome-binding protein
LQTYTTPTGNGPSTAEGGSTAEQAKEKAREQAQQAAGQAKSTLRTQVDQRSTQAGERVGSFASDARSVGEQLRQQGKEQPAKLAEQAADRAERVGDYLKNNDADRILRDVEDFGRRQPWVVIAGGVALGLVASRFLKASSSRRYDEYRGTRAQLPVRTTPGPAPGATTTPSPTTTPTPPPAVPPTPPADTTRSF